MPSASVPHLIQGWRICNGRLDSVIMWKIAPVAASPIGRIKGLCPDITKDDQTLGPAPARIAASARAECHRCGAIMH